MSRTHFKTMQGVVYPFRHWGGEPPPKAVGRGFPPPKYVSKRMNYSEQMGFERSSRVAIYTLGCKANQADSDELAHKFASVGLEIVSPKQQADICVVNTCTVTSKAAYQSRQAVRRLIKKNPGATVVVTGCDADLEAEVFKSIEGVSLVVKNEEKDRLVEILFTRDDCELVLCPSSFVKRARPFLKIQDGCENYCAYCIVPFVRGRCRSLPTDEIIAKLNDFTDRGYYEMVLTGIHIGKYGIDCDTSLNELLKSILAETSICRIRLSSIEPDEIDDELINIIADNPDRICPHLHIPLQSGSDEILARMNRRYNRDYFRNLILGLKEKIPDLAIGADVICGFPGESERHFNDTYDLLDELPVTYLHVFSYSDRKGTAAVDMRDKIGDAVKKERVKSLRQFSTQKRVDYLKSNIGREVTVVFDRYPSLRGRSENYINVLVKDRDELANHHRVRLIGVNDESMTGEIL